MSDSTPQEILKERARELARDIRRASRAFDQMAEIAASLTARKFLADLDGTDHKGAVATAYHDELARDISDCEMP